MYELTLEILFSFIISYIMEIDPIRAFGGVEFMLCLHKVFMFLVDCIKNDPSRPGRNDGSSSK